MGCMATCCASQRRWIGRSIRSTRWPRFLRRIRLPYEHWLELALARRDQEKALNIADRIRRHRFYATQSLGGRLLALRWILEAPAESLSQLAISQRQELLVRYPKFGELSRRAGAAPENCDAAGRSS